ncbi:hypothetical protein EJV47_11815 [Hymenobacter gummosus]|uniref:Uncharacterized protein n=1 Tax=Hymenobacter gummosus TaxID=1776032 RepID=A0A3S0JAZ2_9BACT|nr:hypothetical protein [Hymenobacter gummosus]RTQ50304.1 hypothetical protein EJV47_11815 [Hymenobacter gummosus]
MNLAALLKKPVAWLAILGLLLLLLLAFWYVRRPTDADGNSLILTNREKKALRQDMSQQEVRRRRDSLQIVRADSTAQTLYHEGQQDEENALRLHRRSRQRAAADTSADELQRELSDY